MTIALTGFNVAPQVTRQFPDAVVEANDRAIVIKSDSLFKVAEYLKNTPEFDFDYLNHITGVDYFDYFEMVYQFVSMEHNHSLIVKTRCERKNPVVPSVVSLWQGADYQEREIYDLLGVTFEGHPNLKRIVLWAGYKGHPLRKDYLE